MTGWASLQVFLLSVRACGEVEYPSEQGHVVWLPLDDMGKEQVRFLAQQQRQRDFLDTEDHPAVAEILLDRGTGLPISLVREDPERRRLDLNAVPAVVNQFVDVGGGKRGTTFPAVLVFPSDSDLGHAPLIGTESGS